MIIFEIGLRTLGKASPGASSFRKPFVIFSRELC